MPHPGVLTARAGLASCRLPARGRGLARALPVDVPAEGIPDQRLAQLEANWAASTLIWVLPEMAAGRLEVTAAHLTVVTLSEHLVGDGGCRLGSAGRSLVSLRQAAQKG
jgi:hypothetical protein